MDQLTFQDTIPIGKVALASALQSTEIWDGLHSGTHDTLDFLPIIQI